MGSIKAKEINIQFAMIDDIKKEYDSVQTARGNASASLNKAQSVASGVLLDAKSLRTKAETFLKNYERFAVTAKTIGLEVPSNVSSLESFAKADLKTSDQLTKAGNTILSASKL